MNAYQWIAVIIPVVALHVFLFSLFCRDWLDAWFYSYNYNNRVKLDFCIGVVILLTASVDVLLIIKVYCIFIKFLGGL